MADLLDLKRAVVLVWLLVHLMVLLMANLSAGLLVEMKDKASGIQLVAE
jgi:hypothetical protein